LIDFFDCFLAGCFSFFLAYFYVYSFRDGHGLAIFPGIIFLGFALFFVGTPLSISVLINAE